MSEYTITCDEKNAVICEIFVTGEIEPEIAIAHLDEIWASETYRRSRFVLWNVENCDAFPDFNQFVRIVNHARNHKPDGGPTLIAFYSPAFSNSMLSRVLQGFIQALPYRMSLFDDREAALAWFESTHSNAA